MSISANDRTVNGVLIADIVREYPELPDLVERIAFRKVPAPTLAIEEYDPNWPEHFKACESKIRAAFASTGDDGNGVSVLFLNHVGSTSVPGLPAKAVIDIDLVLSSVERADELYYVPRLEAAGFQYLLREPAWHNHRFFVASDPISCNLHVFGSRCPEVERHRIFKEWLIEHPEDRATYARVKRECAEASNEKGETMQDYTLRKDRCIQEIRMKAFRYLGYVA